jgi:hypothetical protein
MDRRWKNLPFIAHRRFTTARANNRNGDMSISHGGEICSRYLVVKSKCQKSVVFVITRPIEMNDSKSRTFTRLIFSLAMETRLPNRIRLLNRTSNPERETRIRIKNSSIGKII